MSVWSRARDVYGDTPRSGDQVDQSPRLRALQDDVLSAAPRSDWSGAGSDRYADANTKHARALGTMADLDRRLGAEIDRSAAAVASGRQRLDAVAQQVAGIMSSIPSTAAGESLAWSVARKGSSDIAEVLQRSNADLSVIAERIRGIGDEYQALDNTQTTTEFEADGTALPPTTLDLADIVYKDPGVLGDAGMMELVPHSGVWVPDPRSRFYTPTPVRAPLDLRDIQYLGPKGPKGQKWQMELVPGSGAWVPNPNYPGYQRHIPDAPVDLGTIEIVDPGAAIPETMVELWPRSGLLIPNPYLGRPF